MNITFLNRRQTSVSLQAINVKLTKVVPWMKCNWCYLLSYFCSLLSKKKYSFLLHFPRLSDFFIIQHTTKN
jgi:hypothetical protein